MENWRVVMSMTVIMMGWVVTGDPELHKVGGSKGWTNHDVNYTDWSSQEHFFLGDWLLFNFDKRYFNVLEVNKTSYDKCIDQNFIQNVTRGGRDVVQLTETRTYYYLSSGGYCFQGMKVAVHVELQHHDEGSPAPSPAETSAASLLPLYTTKHGIPSMMMGLIMMLWMG